MYVKILIISLFLTRGMFLPVAQLIVVAIKKILQDNVLDGELMKG